MNPKTQALQAAVNKHVLRIQLRFGRRWIDVKPSQLEALIEAAQAAKPKQELRKCNPTT